MLKNNEFVGYVLTKPILKVARNNNDYLVFSIQLDGINESEEVVVWGAKAKDFYNKIQYRDRVHIVGERKKKSWKYISANFVERYATSQQVKDFATKLLNY